MKTLALTVMLAVVVAAGPAGARTIGQIIDDAAIVTEVKARLVADRLSNLTKIDVKSDVGVVTLSGTVDSADRRARAAQIAAAVGGVKTVLNTIEVTGQGGTASTPSPPTSAAIEATGTIASVDPAAGTITLQDGRVLKTTGQTAVWQASSLGALTPGVQVLVRGAEPAGFQPGPDAGARHWRMATVNRVDLTASELTLNDSTIVRVTPATRLHRGATPLTLDQVEPGFEVVVYTPSATVNEASEIAVVWMPTASVR